MEWFEQNENAFFDVVKNGRNIDEGFFNKLSPKLAELGDGFFYLTGMLDHDAPELIITADGDIKKIAFVEELINAAPTVSEWKFTVAEIVYDIYKDKYWKSFNRFSGGIKLAKLLNFASLYCR